MKLRTARSGAVCLLLLFQSLQSAQVSGEKETPTEVPFCKMVSNPEEYDGKTVQTRAIYAVGPEASGLYEPECRTEEYWTWAEKDTYKEWDANTTASLRKLLRSSSRAYVQVVGRFHGPKKVPPCPPGMTCYGGLGDYGHLKMYRFNFVIMRLEQAEPVPPETPWPTIKKHAEPLPTEPAEVPNTLEPRPPTPPPPGT